MKNQITTDWIEQSVSDDRTYLRLFDVSIEWERGFHSIIPFSPSLTISWTARRYMDREISFVWGGLPFPMFGSGFHFGANRKEFMISPIEWIPDWIWKLHGIDIND